MYLQETQLMHYNKVFYMWRSSSKKIINVCLVSFWFSSLKSVTHTVLQICGHVSKTYNVDTFTQYMLSDGS